MTSLEFVDVLRRSNLLGEETLTRFLNLPDDGDGVAHAMVEAGLLTPWQAEKLLAGKFKGFRIGDYTILRHHRKTEWSQDYVAKHAATMRQVVLTVAPPNRVHDLSFMEQFRQSAGGGEVHQVGATYFIVMPYDEGQDALP